MPKVQSNNLHTVIGWCRQAHYPNAGIQKHPKGSKWLLVWLRRMKNSSVYVWMFCSLQKWLLILEQAEGYANKYDSWWLYWSCKLIEISVTDDKIQLNYRLLMERTLTFCFYAWYSTPSVHKKNKLNKIVNMSRKTVDQQKHSMTLLCEGREVRKGCAILSDASICYFQDVGTGSYVCRCLMPTGSLYRPL